MQNDPIINKKAETGGIVNTFSPRANLFSLANNDKHSNDKFNPDGTRKKRKYTKKKNLQIIMLCIVT